MSWNRENDISFPSMEQDPFDNCDDLFFGGFKNRETTLTFENVEEPTSEGLFLRKTKPQNKPIRETAEQPDTDKQAATPSAQQKRYTKPKKEMAEIDIVQDLVNNYSLGLFESIPYVKIAGVDEPVSLQLLPRMVLSSMKTADIRRISARTLSSVLVWLQAFLEDNGRIMKRPSHVILFENGAYDFVADEYTQLSETDFVPVRICANFCPKKAWKTPVFDHFLEDCSGGDIHIKRLILAFIGYVISPCPPNKVFLMAPAAGSGKTVLGNFLRELLGREKTCAVALQNFSRCFEVSQLYGKSANFNLDISSATLSDTTVATLKQLSGNDQITINAKYALPFSYRSYAKLVFACNEGGIRLREPDAGFARRLVVIPFLHSVQPENMDPELPEKLWKERDGIVTQAVYALRKLHEGAYIFPKCKAAEQLHRQYTGTPNLSVQNFVEDVCRLSPEAKAWTADLYKEYRKYCAETDQDPKTLNAFSREIHSVPGVKAIKFQQDNRQAHGVEGITI